MAKSAEYPDLTFVRPRAFGSGRDGKAVRYIVIHYTAGSERSTSAEDGAAYDARRTDGTSTHYFVDSNSVVQCVLTRDRANAARAKGNRLGIQYELCGTVQSRAQWLDAASLPTLRNAARQVARDCRKYGIPVRRLTVTETRRAWTEYPNGPKGIVGHVDCTNAYPEDGGDHTDPGPAFPWDVFLDMVREEMTPTAQEEGDIVTSKAEFREFMHDYVRSEQGREDLAWAILAYDPNADADGSTPNGAVKNLTNPSKGNETVGPATALERAQVAAQVAYQVRDRVDEVKATVADLPARVTALESLLRQILDALTPPPPAGE